MLSITDLRPSTAPNLAGKDTHETRTQKHMAQEKHINLTSKSFKCCGVGGTSDVYFLKSKLGDARGRRATYREAPRGANNIFEKKTGGISPLRTAKVQRCISPKRIKNKNKQRFFKTYDLHLCTLLFWQCKNVKTPQIRSKW